MKRFKLGELADVVQGQIEGRADIEIVGLADLRRARPDELAFAMDGSWLERISESPARAIVVPQAAAALPPDRSYLRVPHPRHAMVRLLQVFDATELPAPGCHALAAVAPSARIGERVSVGPFVTVEAGASVGDDTILWPGAYVGPGAHIGARCRIYPNVTVREGCAVGDDCIVHAGAVIGSDGYGFVKIDRKHVKIPQIGVVRVGDRVEIGANVAIDRATMGETVIGAGTKIDNLVQIAHNVELGEDCLVVAQVGIAGSTRIGDRVTMAGQSGVGGHLTIGDDVVISGQSGVTKSTPAGAIVSGSPARPHRQALQLQAHYQRLPRLVAEVKELRQRLAALEARVGGAPGATDPWPGAAEQGPTG